VQAQERVSVLARAGEARRVGGVGSPVGAGRRTGSPGAGDRVGTDIASETDEKGGVGGGGAYEGDVAGAEEAGVDELDVSGDVERAERSALGARTGRRWTLQLLFPISSRALVNASHDPVETHVLKLSEHIVFDAKLFKLALDVCHHLVDDRAVHLGLLIALAGV
jgi:hypothetical protein